MYGELMTRNEDRRRRIARGETYLDEADYLRRMAALQRAELGVTTEVPDYGEPWCLHKFPGVLEILRRGEPNGDSEHLVAMLDDDATPDRQAAWERAVVCVNACCGVSMETLTCRKPLPLNAEFTGPPPENADSKTSTAGGSGATPC